MLKHKNAELTFKSFLKRRFIACLHDSSVLIVSELLLLVQLSRLSDQGV